MEDLEKVNLDNKKDRKKHKSGAGGARVNAGRKKGQKNIKTLLQEEAAKEIAEKNMLKAEIIANLPPNLQRSSRALKEAIKEINEDEIEKVFKQRIALHSNQLLTALLSAAQGQQFLYKVVPTVMSNGKLKNNHVQVTDPKEIQDYLDNPLQIEGEDFFYITEKQPDINAVNSLLDRFIGRPATKTEPKNSAEKDGGITLVSVDYSLPAKKKQPELPPPPPEETSEEVVDRIIQEPHEN